MIRTIDRRTFQVRFDWTGFALFFGTSRARAFKLFWWRHPRIVLDFWDSNPVVIGRRFR